MKPHNLTDNQKYKLCDNSGCKSNYISLKPATRFSHENTQLKKIKNNAWPLSQYLNAVIGILNLPSQNRKPLGNISQAMPYITKANYSKILRKIDLSKIGEVLGIVYKKPIYYLSKNEEKYLLLMQTLVKDPEKFAVEFYKPVVNKDTFTYVYESEQPPSYHLDKNCDRLNSVFKNFVISSEIKERVKERGGDEESGKVEVKRFRDWFKKYFELFQTDTEKFLKKLDIDWNIQRNLNEIEMLNSGTKDIENYNLEQLERDIDKIISEAGRFFVNNPDKQEIIRRFQKLTFLAYWDKEIYNNDTGLSDNELKDFLRMYDEKYKKPTKKLLIEYYRVKYNPDLSFEGRLLEQLNFKQCNSCEEPLVGFSLPKQTAS